MEGKKKNVQILAGKRVKERGIPSSYATSGWGPAQKPLRRQLDLEEHQSGREQKPSERHHTTEQMIRRDLDLRDPISRF